MLVALIILYVGSQVVSTLLMSATADKNQRRIFLALPFLFVAFIWQFPGRPARVLDHDERVDDPPAVHHQEAAGPAARGGDGCGEGGQGAGGAREKEKGKGKGGKGGGRALGKLSPTAATADGGGGGGGKSRSSNGPPPAPPRKKKKRSGRRR